MMADEAQDIPPVRRPAARPRTILLFVVIFIVVAGLIHWLSPWLLPVRIVEGPLVQQAAEDAVSLVWFTSRPTECQVMVKLRGEEQTLPAEMDGRRGQLRITDLAAGQGVAYRIYSGDRELAGATLRANKPSGKPFSFIVFGDSGKASPEQYLLAGEMTKVSMDFLLHTGDLVYGDGARRKYKDRFFRPYAEMLKKVNFWPCLGNHDVSEPDFGAPYVAVFDLPHNGPPELPPERSYWFDYGTARIAVIDSTVSEGQMRDEIAPWLTEVMSDPGPRWKFASLHHPPYTAGSYEPDEGVQRTLVPVFEATGMDIVFAGHDHMYERTLPILRGQMVEPGQGVVYIVTGAGGARLYDAVPPDERPEYIAALDNQIHSFTHVTIDGDTLSLQQIGLKELVLDEWTFEKSPAAMEPADPAASQPASP